MRSLRTIAVAIAVFALSLIVVSLTQAENARTTLPATPQALAADIDWSQFRFNQKHTGLNPFETILTKSNIKFAGLEWEAQLGDLVDFSSPAVVDGVVYIGSSDGRLWAYPRNGCGLSFCNKPLWVSTGLAQIIDSPTVANGMVPYARRIARVWGTPGLAHLEPNRSLEAHCLL